MRASLRFLALLLTLPAAFSAAPKTRLAYIGLGLDGAWSWIKDAQAEPDAELVAVADPRQNLLERAKGATKAGTRFYTDYARMLDEVKPDAVLATVPNAEHLAVTRACAERRIHVWFQKPMAATAKDAREMERLAKAAGIKLMISYHTLYNGSMQAITARVQAGDVGPIQRLVVRHAFPISKVLSPTYEAQFLDPALHGGGALMDQGTYGIDYAVWLLGRPTRVMATGKTLHERPGLQSEDEAWAILDYPKATAVIYGGWWAEPDIGPGVGETTISGPKGVLQRDLGKVTFQQGADREKGVAADREPRVVAPPAIPRERSGGVAHFIDCIRNDKPIDAPHSASLNVIVNEVVDAAYESMRTGRAVVLPAR
jgi:predicted dehydrogenase